MTGEPRKIQWWPLLIALAAFWADEGRWTGIILALAWLAYALNEASKNNKINSNRNAIAMMSTDSLFELLVRLDNALSDPRLEPIWDDTPTEIEAKLYQVRVALCSRNLTREQKIRLIRLRSESMYQNDLMPFRVWLQKEYSD